MDDDARFDACREVDPVLAGWVAVTLRRPFSAELLPTVRARAARGQVAVRGANKPIGMSRRAVARTIGLLVVALGWAAVPFGARATEYPRALQLAEGTQSA